jgi:hypothetical protein
VPTDALGNNPARFAAGQMTLRMSESCQYGCLPPIFGLGNTRSVGAAYSERLRQCASASVTSWLAGTAANGIPRCVTNVTSLSLHRMLDFSAPKSERLEWRHKGKFTSVVTLLWTRSVVRIAAGIRKIRLPPAPAEPFKPSPDPVTAAARLIQFEERRKRLVTSLQEGR